MNHCLFKAKDTKGAVGNTVDYSSLTESLVLKYGVNNVNFVWDLPPDNEKEENNIKGNE